MTWQYDFSVGDLMRRANDLHKQHSQEVQARLAPYPKKRKPRKVNLKQPKAAPVCVYCGFEVSPGRTVCWVHEDVGEWEDVL